MTPVCPYCETVAVIVGGDVIYPWLPHFHAKRFWKCPSCPSAYVGCHPGTENALGRLADPKLRQAKSHAHAVFDKIWERKAKRDGCSKGEARSKGYRWLANQLGIDPEQCHIGMFDVEQCVKVVEICRPYNRSVS